MEITRQELAALNFYRASELHGGLILGAMVRRARHPDLILALTTHSEEEVRHARLWTETILAVGGTPCPVRDTYQTRYAEVVGTPLTMLQVLALTQVFERRVYRHFLDHLGRSGTHPAVRATLRRMLDEEVGHLTWVNRWLEQQAATHPAEVQQVLREYTEADDRVYASLVVEYGWVKAE